MLRVCLQKGAWSRSFRVWPVCEGGDRKGELAGDRVRAAGM